MRRLLDTEVLPNLSPLAGVAKAIEAVLVHRVRIIFRPMPTGDFKDAPLGLCMWQSIQARLPGCVGERTFHDCFLFYADTHSDQSKVLFAVAHELGHILLHFDKIITPGKARYTLCLPPKEKEKKDAEASPFFLDFTAREEKEADAFAAAITKEHLQPRIPNAALTLPKALAKPKRCSSVSMAPIAYLRGDEGIGTFQNVKLTELIQLASRAQAVIKKYGERRVEKVFEVQLALLIQSLGFYVVSTRTGYRTVDLICISDDSAQATTFLIEAKTTKVRYALPTKDERALCDYIEDVRKHIAPLPAIRFVLIVGNSPSKTLQSKLSALQARMGVPMRFCPVRLLVALRRKMPGPVSADEFTGAILGESVVMTNGFVKRIALAYKKKHEALANLIRTSVGRVR